MSNQNYNNLTQQVQPPLPSPYDRTLVFIVFFLIILGFLAIFSAGAPKCISQNLPSTYFVFRQFVCFLVGLGAMIFISKI